MALRDRMYLLTSASEVDEFLAQFPTSVIFKAGGCHKTNMGFTQVEKALDSHEAIHLGFVRSLEDPSVAEYVSSRTGIAHQAPQVILFVAGKSVYDSDHWQITHPTLSYAVNRHVLKASLPSMAENELVQYRTVLKGLIDDQLSDAAFRQQWQALPRSHFDLADLVAEMDSALCCGERCAAGGCSALPLAERKRATLKAKATQLYSLLF